jgi:hypothetical protein
MVLRRASTPGARKTNAIPWAICPKKVISSMDTATNHSSSHILEALLWVGNTLLFIHRRRVDKSTHLLSLSQTLRSLVRTNTFLNFITVLPFQASLRTPNSHNTLKWYWPVLPTWLLYTTYGLRCICFVCWTSRLDSRLDKPLLAYTAERTGMLLPILPIGASKPSISRNSFLVTGMIMGYDISTTAKDS